jgi:hypothetical protein
LLDYLDKIKSVRLSLFSLKLQQFFKGKVGAWLGSLSLREHMVKDERELDIVSHWAKRIRLQNDRISQLVSADL